MPLSAPLPSLPTWFAQQNVRGRVAAQAPLADHTWFRVGGPAEVLFQPADLEDLSQFLAHCPREIPITVIGLASNLLIRDGGVPGVVVKLGPTFARAVLDGAHIVAGAGAVDGNVARLAAAHGIGGLAFLGGIPGSIGGAVRMNAGAYGRETKDVLLNVTALDRRGNRLEYPVEACGFSYRHCSLPDDLIFTQARLGGTSADPEKIKDEMRAIQEARGASQPIRERTGGSTFANPDNDPEGRKAWQLIDLAGCRGLTIGGAQMAEKHCNFMINTGTATAADLEALGEEVRRRVADKTGITLRWEIRRIGVPAGAEAAWRA
jgi:UDP-N-acetylmuramate dehydrogenase